MEGIKSLPALTNKDIYEAILRGGKTLEELAEECGTSYNKFIDRVKRLKDFRALVQASAKNERQKRHLANRSAKNKVNIPNDDAGTITDEEQLIIKLKETEELLLNQQEVIKSKEQQKRNAQSEFDVVRLALSKANAIYQEAENAYKEADAAFRNAQTHLKMAKNGVTSCDLSRSQQQEQQKIIDDAVRYWDNQRRATQSLRDRERSALRKAEDLKMFAEVKYKTAKKVFLTAKQELCEAKQVEVDLRMQYNATSVKLCALREKNEGRQNIYLVCPGYKGLLPEQGRIISCRMIDHTNFVAEKGTELLIPISAEDGKRLGYRYLKHLRAESDFVKLILKYIFDERVEEFWVLTNKQRVIQLLKEQGIEAVCKLEEVSGLFRVRKI